MQIPGSIPLAVTAGSSPADSNGSNDSQNGSMITANDFLTLLVTELKNQDPTANQDPNAYVDQLVQVNSLQQLIQINQNTTTPTGSAGTGSGTGTGSGSSIVSGSNAIGS